MVASSVNDKRVLTLERRWDRRWTLLLPVIFITYSLAYLDRANFSFAAAGGMAKDLGTSAAENSLLGALFFLGYFLFQISAPPMRRNTASRN